jgi:hypothetical protein
MHSDGQIEDLLPELIGIGVFSINAQLNCMDLDRIAGRFHHKIAFWGGLDRQYLLPHGTREENREAARRIADAFYQYGRTGLIAQGFLDKDGKPENLEAALDEWIRA